MLRLDLARVSLIQQRLQPPRRRLRRQLRHLSLLGVMMSVMMLNRARRCA